MNSRPLSEIRVPALDGLRGVAILLVLLNMFEVPQPDGVTSGAAIGFLESVMKTGWTGVQLFFVLSGYLITGGLLDTQKARNYFGAFYARRTLRIFPLYYGILIAAFVVRPLVILKPLALNEAAGDQVWLWTYLYNWVHPAGHVIIGFTHFWSLAVEEQFYIVWPLVVLHLAPRQVLRLSGALIVVALVSRLGLRLAGASHEAAYMFTICRMDALAVGAAVAAMVRLPNWGLPPGPARQRVVLAGLVSLGAAFALALVSTQESILLQSAGMTLLALGCATVVLLVADPAASGTVLASVLAFPVLRALGKYSYGLYVFHLPLHAFVLSHLVARMPGARSGYLPLIYFLFATAVTFVVAFASYHAYEKQFLKLKSRFRAEPAAAPA